MKTTNLILAVAVIGYLCGTGAAQSGGTYQITQSVIAGGGTTSSSGGQYSLAGTVGQSHGGQLTPAGSYSLHAGFWTPALSPTAAAVSVTGRATTSDGLGIRNAIVRLTGLDGTVREVRTGALGVFRFDDVPVGEIYTLSIAANRFTFNEPDRVLVANSDISDILFVAR